MGIGELYRVSSHLSWSYWGHSGALRGVDERVAILIRLGGLIDDLMLSTVSVAFDADIVGVGVWVAHY